MIHRDISHARNDEEYQLSLSSAEWTQLSQHSAGLIELGERDLADVGGGVRFCGSYDYGIFIAVCYCDDYTGQLSYCDLIWQGRGGNSW